MRKLPRDLVLILRTEAKNQRTPPIDYVIAEDGGRMVHRPNPDIAMAELLEEAATALAAKDAELVEMERQREVERISKEHARRECDRAEAQLAEARKALANYDRWLNGRDAYIVQKGLWQNFVASLPGSPTARRALEAQGGE